jgi:eukaryotic-like serine/threonine-protein kinase
MDSHAPAPPRHLGKYRLDRLLGKGGMGEVYEAWDTTLERTVAVKTVRAESDDAQQIERFRREGKAAARLRHPLIVTIYELGEADGRLYIAMEYLEGESLAAAARAGRLTLEQRLEVLGLILDGLHHAHQHGVVHRDVKPANVQLLADGGLKILDFGIARMSTADSLSHTGMVLGTVPYMSPEQLRGERVDHRTDVYAAGVVGYELLTGRRPFDGETLTEIVLKVINDPLPPMPALLTDRYPALESVLARALDKQAALRFQSASEMACALRAAIAIPPLPAGPPPASTTYRVPLVPAAPPPTWRAPVEPRGTAAPAPESAPPVAPVPLPAPPMQPAFEPQAGRRSRLRVAALTVLGLGVLSSAALMGRGARDQAAPVGPPPPARTGAPPPASPADHAPALPAHTPRTARPDQPAAPALLGDARLARAVAAELSARGVRVRGGDHVEARASISVRRSPFAASGALTADYTASASLRGAGRAAARCDVDGRALEFGEAPVRAAAVRRAAEQLADCLAARTR